MPPFGQAVRNCPFAPAFSPLPRRTTMDQPKTSPAGEAEQEAGNDPGSDLARASRAMEQKIAEEKRRELPIDHGGTPDQEEAALDAEVSAEILNAED
jgi:hypothetical protein